jgi:hypothetical protein
MENDNRTSMKNLYKSLAWIFTAAGAILMLLAVIAFIAGGRFLGAYWNTYFWTVSPFLMFAAVFLLFHLAECKAKKE